MTNSLYLHVPFCDSICAYCDFERCKSHPLLIERWLERILFDIKQRDDDFKTIYIGGGTPTALNEDQLEKLLSGLDRFHPHEFTIEANSENLTIAKLEIMAKHSINRISIGVQSLNPRLLEIIQRKHDAQKVFSWLVKIHQYIPNISVDMIYGLPTQTLQEWLADLNSIAQCEQVSHISMYSLTIEKNSKFGRNDIQPIDEDLDASMYMEAIACLKKWGFEHYEISNFARNQKYSEHNLNYWQFNDFAGIGCGAYGLENHVYYHLPFILNEYLDNNLNVESEPLTLAQERFEMVMMALRCKNGINYEQFKKRFGVDFKVIYADALNKHLRLENLVEHNQGVHCSEAGMALLNSVLLDFMDE